MNYKSVLLSLLIFYIPALNIYADDAPVDGDTIKLRYTAKDVVVESFKQNNNLYAQPVAASLLSEKELKDYNVLNIKEVTALVPNFFMPEYGSKMYSPVYIRGIGSRINAPSVGLYVDGIPYFDRSSFDFNVNDVERIEVLRGPQGTLYGRNTMGGIINVYTKSPFKYKETNLGLSGGNYNYYQTSLSHYGNVDERIGYSISGNFMHSGGYFKNKYTDKKADPIDAVSTRGRLSWRIQPRLTAHLTFAYEYSDQDGYPYRLYDKGTGEMDEVNYNSPSFYRRNMSTNGLNIEYITDNFKLGSQSSFQFYDGEQGLDQDFTPNDLYYVDFYQRQQMYSQEFNIKSIKENSRYDWQFGLFGFHQNYFQINDTDNRTKGDHQHTIQDVSNPTGGFAAYHQSTINNLFTENLSLIFGVRYDWEKTKSTLIKATSTAINDPVKDRASFSQVTPKASIQYSFNKEGLAYLSVSRGYKTGGFNNTADTIIDRTFEPEHSWSYEIGAKSGFMNNLLYLDLTLFYISWENQQISQPKSTTGQGYILRNAGQSDSRGIEFAAQLNPLKNFSCQVSYGYTRAKYRDYKKDKNITYDNNYLPLVPQNTLSIAANYAFDIKRKWLETIVLNAQYSGVGKLYFNDENTVSQSFYGLYNGKVSFINKQFSVDLWTKNMGSKEYISYYFTALNKDYVQKGKPFTCGINMNLKF
ncbi:MAG: TonB-dependent receptor [Dysgonomonas sp.]